MCKGGGQDSFTCAATKINEGTSCYVEGIMPAIFICVPPILLNPREDIWERFKYDLAVHQFLCTLLDTFLGSFALAEETRILIGEFLG